MTDWSSVRARFPAVERCAYLNTAGGGPISLAAAEAGGGYYRASCADGDVHWDEWLGRVESVRGRLAALLGVGADDLAFVANASAGLNLTARMLAERREVLLVEDDFPSVTWPWMQQGFEVRFVPTGRDGGATLDELEAARGARTDVLAIGLVQYRTGYRYDLAALGSWCRERGIALVVDATQALGAVEVDAGSADVDFMVSSAYKWLNAGYGVGCLYVNPRWRSPRRYSAVGWRSARDPYALDASALDVADAASVLEAGHPPFPGVFSLGAALETHEAIGMDVIESRVLSLANRVRAGVEDLGLSHLSAADPGHYSPIVAVPTEDAGAEARRLRAAGVLVSARGEALRISTHLYNLERDVEALLGALEPGAR